jgi:hypothetical protein
VVFLVGEAGIGKSRLLYEFRRALGAGSHLYAEGRCASFGVARQGRIGLPGQGQA